MSGILEKCGCVLAFLVVGSEEGVENPRSDAHVLGIALDMSPKSRVEHAAL